MTSVISQRGQVQANKLYVNIAACQSSIFTSTLDTKAPWVSNGGIAAQLATAGSAIFRDLGTTYYVPTPNPNAVGAVPGISTVLRKVQLIPAGGAGTYGTGGANAGSDVDYFTGYIKLNALQQGGGGDGAPVTIARLN